MKRGGLDHHMKWNKVTIIRDTWSNFISNQTGFRSRVFIITVACFITISQHLMIPDGRPNDDHLTKCAHIIQYMNRQYLIGVQETGIANECHRQNCPVRWHPRPQIISNDKTNIKWVYVNVGTEGKRRDIMNRRFLSHPKSEKSSRRWLKLIWNSCAKTRGNLVDTIYPNYAKLPPKLWRHVSNLTSFPYTPRRGPPSLLSGSWLLHQAPAPPTPSSAHGKPVPLRRRGRARAPAIISSSWLLSPKILSVKEKSWPRSGTRVGAASARSSRPQSLINQV